MFCVEMDLIDMVIGFHYWRFGIGGAEHVTLELITRFQRMGYLVILYTDEPEHPGDFPLPDNVIRLVVPVNPKERSQFWINEALNRGVKIIIYGTWLSPYAPLDCQTIHDTGMKLVYSVHGSASYPIDKDNGMKLLEIVQQCAQLADVIVCLSDVDALFWSLFCNNVVVVTNPVADYLGPVSISTRKRKGLNVVWVGRFDPVEKRPDLAIKAFATLVSVIPQAHLTMVGGGNDKVRLELEQLAKQLKVNDRVEFTGSVPSSKPYLKQADVFLMTSPTEGFPLSLSEAMHEGLPCVIFEMPHLVLAHNCSGIVQVPWKDTDSMGLALSDILTNNRYEELSSCVLEQYHRVCETDISRQWSTVIKMALAEKNNSLESKSSRLVRSFINAYKRLDDKRISNLEELQHLRDQISILKTEKKNNYKEVESVRQSYAFKIGSIILWLPRSIRKIIKMLTEL